MRSVLALLVFALFVSLSFAKVLTTDEVSKFTLFEQKFGKSYSSHEERHNRMVIFAENLQKVDRMNAEHGSAVFGVTKFMDMNPEEFKGHYLNLQVPNPLPQAPSTHVTPVSAELPASVDWRNTQGVITPVKNQEQCGSCWAFSATESIESAWVLAGNQQVILAPQQIVDCDKSDDGCGGGYPSTAMEYVIGAGGQELEKDYPYTGQDGQCTVDKADFAASINSWHYVSQSAGTEMTTMMTYVATTGPVSVCVDAAPWQYYTGGVLRLCGNQIDHAVQAVGYGVVNSIDVWYVRNSWGADWGEQGYIWVERGKNLCEIATIVTAANATASA